MFGIFQLIGILIPFAGIVALLRQGRQSESSVRLLLATVGCMIMNSGYMLFIISETDSEAMTALKMEYLGSALFYFFFMMFLLSYLHIHIPKPIIYLWAAFECAVTGIYWENTLRRSLFGNFIFSENAKYGYMTVRIEQSTLYLIRYSTLSFILFIGLIYGTLRLLRTKLRSERFNIARLVGAQFVIAVSLIIQLLLNPSVDIVPMFSALSILSVVVSMLTDGFFGVTDKGHDWIFAQMEDAYIIVDEMYGYLDSNQAARSLFADLEKLKQHDKVTDVLYHIFISVDTICELNGRYFAKKVTEITNRGKPSGYGMLLEDITEQQKHLELINSYNAQLEAAVARQTAHIQAVQDSIITGIASVVESRDNSTGGHINRTSAVVNIFAHKLLEHPELGLDDAFLKNVTKAAPMHDLGKVAVDDVILRKPGRFTDEEYAKMKEHSAEGARVLSKVLAEVDDEAFVRIAINIAHFHHERYDGKGYPDGLHGEEIPVEARIMALADVFDALVSKRCYKEAFNYDKAFLIIEEGLGTQFDPVLGKLFIECRSELEKYYDVS